MSATRLTPAQISSHAIHAAAARRGAANSSSEQGAAQSREARFGRDMTRDEIPRDVRIRQFEKLGEGRALFAGRVCVGALEIPEQQEIELLHAAPATPLELAQLDAVRAQCCL